MNQKELMILAVTFFLTVIAWVTFEVFAIKKQTPSEQEISAINTNYVIDVSILERLKQKKP